MFAGISSNLNGGVKNFQEDFAGSWLICAWPTALCQMLYHTLRIVLSEPAPQEVQMIFDHGHEVGDP
jgi:hypothetical protein